MKQFKIFILIIFSFFVFAGNAVFAEADAQSVPASQPVQQTSEPSASQQSAQQSAAPSANAVVSDIPETIPEKNYENLKKIKDSASTSHLFTIVTVILSLIVLILCFWGVFKLYRKIQNKGYIVEAPPKETLASPKDFKSAVNLFLGKTDE